MINTHNIDGLSPAVWKVAREPYRRGGPHAARLSPAVSARDHAAPRRNDLPPALRFLPRLCALPSAFPGVRPCPGGPLRRSGGPCTGNPAGSGRASRSSGMRLTSRLSNRRISRPAIHCGSSSCRGSSARRDVRRSCESFDPPTERPTSNFTWRAEAVTRSRCRSSRKRRPTSSGTAMSPGAPSTICFRVPTSSCSFRSAAKTRRWA